MREFNNFEKISEKTTGDTEKETPRENEEIYPNLDFNKLEKIKNSPLELRVKETVENFFEDKMPLLPNVDFEIGNELKINSLKNKGHRNALNAYLNISTIAKNNPYLKKDFDKKREFFFRHFLMTDIIFKDKKIINGNTTVNNQNEEGKNFFDFYGKEIVLQDDNYNNCIAKKINNDGSIGIFTNDNKLTKIIEIDYDQDILKTNHIINKQPIKIEDYFKKQTILEENSVTNFSEKYNEYYQNFKNLSIRFDSLKTLEQTRIIEYGEKSSDNKKKLTTFSEKYGAQGLKTFAACQKKETTANSIIELSQKLSPNQALDIFSKINSVYDLADQYNFSFLKNDIFNDDDQINFQLIKSQFLERIEKLIHKIILKINNPEKNEDDVDFLIDYLKNISNEEEILLATLRAAKLEGFDLNLEDIKKLNLSIKQPHYNDLTDNKKQEIIDIARANWESFGNSKMAKVVIDDLKKSLENMDGQKWYLLKYNHKIIGFVRFEPTNHDTTYAGSFNVSQDLRGLNIGNRMMEKALIKEGENSVLEASASVKIPAGCAYVEKVGFVADGLIEDYHNTGETLFSIKLDNEKNKTYHYRPEEKTNQAELEPNSLIGIAIEPNKITTALNRPVIVVKCNLTKDFSSYQKVLTTLLPKCDDNLNQLEKTETKYTMTRYWQDKSSADDIRYLVFEKNQAQN